MHANIVISKLRQLDVIGCARLAITFTSAFIFIFTQNHVLCIHPFSIHTLFLFSICMVGELHLSPTILPILRHLALNPREHEPLAFVFLYIRQSLHLGTTSEHSHHHLEEYMNIAHLFVCRVIHSRWGS